MKVALDSGRVQGERAFGIGVHTKNLVEALDNEAKKRNDIKIDYFDFSENLERLQSTKYDLLHYPYFHPHFLTLPSKKITKTVITVHDLIPLVYPKQYPAGIKGNIKNLIQKKRLNNVDAIITISETSKKDIIRFLKVPSEKVHAIHIAPSPVFKKENDRKRLNRIVAKYNLPNKFVLYLGDVYYSKNVPTLILACAQAKVPLVIVGKQATEIEANLSVNLKNIAGPRDWLRYLTNEPHPEQAHYKLLKEMFENEGKVIRLGYVPDRDLIPIMNLATVYCQPSYYEGFGLGVVHAFASGVPVVAAKTQALVEVVQDAALIADPFKPDDMALKIRKLMDDPSLRAHYIRKGNERLQKFSWMKTAEKTISVYEEVCKT